MRFFAPYHGIDEDPVTGSACGPLLLVLIKLGLINNYLDDSFIKIELTCFHQLSPIKIRVLVSDQVWLIQLSAHLITKMYFFKLNNHQLIDNTKLNTLTQKHAQNMNMILILTLSYM